MTGQTRDKARVTVRMAVAVEPGSLLDDSISAAGLEVISRSDGCVVAMRDIAAQDAPWHEVVKRFIEAVACSERQPEQGRLL